MSGCCVYGEREWERAVRGWVQRGWGCFFASCADVDIVEVRCWENLQMASSGKEMEICTKFLYTGDCVVCCVFVCSGYGGCGWWGVGGFFVLRSVASDYDDDG